jgi:hypothetical protein
VAFTGNKPKAKLYKWHSGWMGGLKTRNAEEMLEKNPVRVIERAVQGMLPHNTLRETRMARLRLFPDADHDHANQVAASLAYAPEHMHASRVRPAPIRRDTSSGVFVRDPTEGFTPAQLAEFEKQLKPLLPDEGLAREYEAWRTARFGGRAEHDEALERMLWARARELDAEEEEEKEKAKRGAAAAAAGGARGEGLR